MSKLNEYDIQFLIDKLKKGEPIPDDYKYKIFPTKQKEYELVYAGKMRKEDILANEDGVFPVPLQVEKVFNGVEHPAGDKDWRNMIVFGDNLQFLKTVCENKAPLIKDKVKGKVKLIYIDPPFGTGDEYDGGNGRSAYSAKRKGADFVEFLRRRLMLAREILADDGSIFIRLDYHFGYYIKMAMDEIFDRSNFRNEIVINRFKRQLRGLKQFNHATDCIFFYSNSGNVLFNEIFRSRICSFCGQKAEPQWLPMSSPELRNPPERTIFGKVLLPPRGRHWTFSQEKINKMSEDGRIRIENNDAWTDLAGNKHKGVPEYLQTEETPVDSNWTDVKGYVRSARYPTENPEELLERVILSASKPNDLVLDFFAGSGTTAAVAEKLGRRWIACDIGKLSFYTMQKRILTIQNSKDLEKPKKKYGKKARSFVTVNTGLYDLQKVFKLKNDDYINFVMNLFEVEPVNKKIGGIKIDGQKKDGYYVLIYPYWEFKKASVDQEYLEDLHLNIGKKVGGRLYIIAPANYVDFISDYHEIDRTKYYFLKVPYQIIKELHKVQFKKFRQPQSKKNVNDLDDAIGFHFIRQPDVESKIVKKSGNMEIHITKFLSNYLEEETDSELKNFESLAMVLIDNDYNDREFVMDEFYFAEDLLPKKKKTEKEDEQNEDEIKEDLKRLDMLVIPLNKEDCGDKIMVVYVDIYGNEFKEVLSVKK